MTNRKVNILVVEDDEYSRDALAHLLVAEGYNAESAQDGEAGLIKARETRPDVIVLDLNLPGMDGNQVIGRIREDESLASIPILVVTGDEDKKAQEAVKSGANAYLTKPLELDALINAIKRLNSALTAA
jgi:CheY-like chemotaxis protein